MKHRGNSHGEFETQEGSEVGYLNAARGECLLPLSTIMATASSSEGPYATNPDGSAKDPAAFQKAVLADADKMKALEAEPEVVKVVKGQDLQEFQELLKTVYAVNSSTHLFGHSCHGDFESQQLSSSAAIHANDQMTTNAGG